MLAASARAQVGQAERLRLPLFSRLMAELARWPRVVVMELGPCNHSLVNVLSGYQSCLHVLDLPAQLPALNAIERDSPNTNTDLDRFFQTAVPMVRETPIDVVLCWNLLDYLDAPALRSLIQHLSPRLSEQARVHAVTSYSDTSMPAQPPRWAPRLTAEQVEQGLVEEVTVTVLDDAQRNAPRYTPRQLESLLPGLRIDSSMLLSNGMQEHLLKPAGAR